MTPVPDFDELVGLDLDPGDRDRLRRVHALLVEAGPPAEVPPELEAGPTLAITLGGRRRKRFVPRRVMLLAAATCVLALAFLGGYLAGNTGGGVASAETLNLVGTKAAPSAFASLELMRPDDAGNWPMHLSVTGLPKLPDRAYYEVYLVRNGKPWAPCGTFVVYGAERATTVDLNAPYRLKPGDTWIVTMQRPGIHGPGDVMLKPIS